MKALFNFALLITIFSMPVTWAAGWVTDKSTGCKFWETDKILSSLEITWIGTCTKGMISGKGTLLWRWKENGRTRTAIYTGEAWRGYLTNGKFSSDDGETKIMRGIEKKW